MTIEDKINELESIIYLLAITPEKQTRAKYLIDEIRDWHDDLRDSALEANEWE